MKIIIVGPIYPYKGGIAHYTGLLANSLSNENEVQVISFKLQYPRFLYKKEQKDYNNDNFLFKNVFYLLNTINPLSYMTTVLFISRMEPDLIIFQWWHPFFSLVYWFILKLLRKKIKVIFLCHNILPHERFPFQKLLAKVALKQADAYIVHSKSDEIALNQLIHAPVYKKTVHPTYSAFRKKEMSRKEARSELNILKNEKIILFFGFIREYKGLKHLICALPRIVSKITTCRLLIVGDFFDNNKEEYLKLITDNGCENFIKIFDGYIPDNDVEKFFTACDVVVLPYESATQSGIIQIAYGFEKPVIVTDVGGLADVVEDGKTGYIVPPLNDQKLVDTIIHFFEMDNFQMFEENIRAQSDRYSWDVMNKIIHELYEEVLKDIQTN